MSGMTTRTPTTETCGHMMYFSPAKRGPNHYRYRCGAPATGHITALGPGPRMTLPRCAQHLRAGDPEPGYKERR